MAHPSAGPPSRGPATAGPNYGDLPPPGPATAGPHYGDLPPPASGAVPYLELFTSSPLLALRLGDPGALSSQLSAAELVQWVHRLQPVLDGLADKYGVHKVHPHDGGAAYLFCLNPRLPPAVQAPTMLQLAWDLRRTLLQVCVCVGRGGGERLLACKPLIQGRALRWPASTPGRLAAGVRWACAPAARGGVPLRRRRHTPSYPPPPPPLAAQPPLPTHPRRPRRPPRGSAAAASPAGTSACTAATTPAQWSARRRGRTSE
jgi:hypothetical protein